MSWQIERALYRHLARCLLPPWVRAGGVDDIVATYEIGREEVASDGLAAILAYRARELGSLFAAAARARLEGSPAEMTPIEALSPARDSRPLRVAWILALVAHFVAFSIVLPFGDGARVEARPERQVTVIRRLPPPPPPPEKPVRRVIRGRVSPVPIPSPEPDEPEPVIDLDEILPAPLDDEPHFELWVAPPPSLPPAPVAQPAIARVGVDVARPHLLEKVKPVYPRLARRAGLECTVLLEARIDAQGSVADLRSIRSCGLGLEQAALAAVARWRYTPTRVNGRPVDVMMTVSVHFALR